MKSVSTRVSDTMHKLIHKRMEHTVYMNVSQYLRALIVKDLESRGFLEEKQQ